MNTSKKEEREGTIHTTRQGYTLKVIKYENNSNVYFIFDGDTIVRKAEWREIVEGKVTNPIFPTVFGVGFIGEGIYKATIGNKHTKCYRDWKAILQRGCDEEYKRLHPTYKDVIVNPEVYNFQDFAEWWYNNYYKVEGEQMCIDKDILIKDNKEYGFNTMIFVPQRINKLFTKSDALRGDFPIGVSYHRNKYRATCSILNGNNKKQKFLGYYNSPEEAFEAYKTFKESYIKQIADEYKGRIPDRLYEAMYKWEVDIND